MTVEEFKNMIRFADILGIRTVGELFEYKKKKGAETAQDLYLCLYFDAFRIVKDAPKRNNKEDKAS